MKLLLTSTGLANENVKKFFVSQFDRLDNKTACIIACGRNAEEQFYIDECLQEMSDLKIKITELNINGNDNLSGLPDYDIYYVCGGNTFYILDRMRKTRIDEILINVIEKGKFYVGVSAGSVIPGPDIEIAGKLGDPNDINLENLTGFNLVPYIVSPHYNKDKEETILEKFKKEREGQQVIPITDDQAVFVENEKMIFI